MKKIMSALLLSFVFFAFFSSNTSYAYQLFSTSDCPKVPYPTNIFYWIDPGFLDYSGKTTEVNESINKWDDLPEIQFTTNSPDSEIIIHV